MGLFSLSCVLRGFLPATYLTVRLGKNPCAALLTKKSLIYEKETRGMFVLHLAKKLIMVKHKLTGQNKLHRLTIAGDEVLDKGMENVLNQSFCVSRRARRNVLRPITAPRSWRVRKWPPICHEKSFSNPSPMAAANPFMAELPSFFSR